ncbi:hypothetical protein DL96DRAFT_391773 [Flagelloscypha sp. PMI_526]|nr:hypothetical protein DL96DRAFT_391773 [Flagelloscypha sp. PMI_526]
MRQTEVAEFINARCSSFLSCSLLYTPMAPTCTTCTRSFKDKFALARHLETSSSEHPSCSLCSKRFTSTEALEAHYQGTANSKHPNCIVCGRGFVDKQALAQHRRAGCQPSPPKVKKYHPPEPASGRDSVTPLSSQHHRTSSLDSNAQEFLPSCAASFNALRNSPATPLSVSTATAQTFLPLTSEPSPWRYSQDTLVSQDTPSSPEARFTYLPVRIFRYERAMRLTSP